MAAINSICDPNPYKSNNYQWHYPGYYHYRETEVVTETVETTEYGPDGKMIKRTVTTKTVSKPTGYRYSGQPITVWSNSDNGNRIQTTTSLQADVKY